jgi:hypothetical protein
MTAVTHAQDMVRLMVQRESRGNGDVDNAMGRLEARYGIPKQTFWSLKYRPPKDVFVGVYLKIIAAYQAECERQERLLRHEREITKAKTGPFHAAVIAAEAVDSEAMK